MVQTQGTHAIVIGGSMAGLLAARALADHFTRVTIVERDSILGTPEPRKGVPQGNHVHALLKSGEHILEDFFPGLRADLIADGSQVIDFAQDILWYHHDVWKKRYSNGMTLLLQTRPALEAQIAQRVQTLSNITWRNGWSLQDIITTADHSRVTAVTLQDHAGRTETLTADLIVDASGRSSKTPQWLEAHQYAAPTETNVRINLTYTSRFFARPADFQGDWKLLIVNAGGPHDVRGGLVFALDQNRWMVTLEGYSGETMPQTDAEFLEFARSLAQPEIYEAIRDAQPISEIKTFRYPAEQRRHYERLERFPDGLIVMGDAFTSFDPVFGQGMTSAAKQAALLAQLLEQNSSTEVGFSVKFHRAVGKMVATPWLLATSEDLRFPKTEAARPFWMPIMQWYTLNMFRLSSTDEQTHRAFSLVMNLLAEPVILFHPAIIAKVMGQAFTRIDSHPSAPRAYTHSKHSTSEVISAAP